MPVATEPLTGQITMARETLAECLTDETKAILREHWAAIATHKDIPLDPDFARYEMLETYGILRCYILREDGAIRGYAVFVVTPSMKYRTSLEAYCDLVYVQPHARRGLLGVQFLRWCDAQLAADHVQLVRHCVQRTYNYSPVLTRLGYEPEQTVYCRRLDRRTDERV